jgi:RimJ/RimL family protein N-acetyltransferase
MEEHQRWFAGLNASSRISLIFELNNCPVGVVNVTDIDKEDNKCSWGFYLGERDLPKGAGLLMGYHGLQFIFEKLGIRKLCSKSFAFNESSIKYHKKLGFGEEGLLLRDSKKNDEFEDVVVFALFKNQWEQQREEIENILLESKKRG